MSYGNQFEFRVPPHGGQRSGRFYLDEDAAVVIGAPVVVDTAGDENDLGLLPVNLATGSQARPKPGMGGILVYEHKNAESFAGYDTSLTTYSDIDTAPAAKACQVVNGSEVKVVLRNTSDSTFLNTRDYEGRTMVAGLGGATPTVTVGEYLTPGTGDDTSGYWAVTATEANAWLVVTKVDNDRNELEARVLF
jgi:hypothetical protein